MKKFILLSVTLITFGLMNSKAQDSGKQEGMVAMNNSATIFINGNQVVDEVTITFHLVKPSIVTCSILDLIGKPVKSFTTLQDAGTTNMAYSIPELQNGLYFISIRTAESMVTRRMIVQR